ncbi:sigma-54-dependent transcriptional regulator [Hymenobacter chitinivorans]|uniref:DNA-binding NtrC family response regulator n=1 Tax=Hymenobacter chitinivorans DSM 11115 TaxID=1121954 RepID=A0A2M9BR78_9BACT|nr:sigma-54 dependent transcriptional regulator [Hymenobacter chitinivorans]PJJ60443.1 DNA-binding NtrC family response regulator [Hymenobacter chitinivorans DSM 11115]
MPTGTLLLIDDEGPLRQAIARMLELEGYTVLQAPDARRGLETLQQHADEVLVILSDVKLPDGFGLDLLPRYQAKAPLAEVILLTAFGTITDGVQAMKQGAFDYLTKGDSDDQLVVVVDRAVEKAQLQRRVAELEKKVGTQYSFESMIGHAPALEQAKRTARQVAQTDATVLLEGPTGAGKELFAQAIHYGSPRRSKPFVALNCSAFPKDLLESELFGYKKGAFTGAQADKKGLLEEASGGTLFLDEIGELDVMLQAKLLRVLETQEFTKIGDTRPTRVNVRVVAATNRNLRQEAEQGHFRADLYYRLSVVVVAVPPLSARRSDVPLLTRFFLLHFAAKLRRRPLELTPEALQALENYPWPGNVRELKNVLERASILTPPDQPLTVDDLPVELQLAALNNPRPDAPPPDERNLRSAEKQHIQRVLLEEHGNKTETARVLGIALTTLYRKIQDYGL